MRFSKKISDKIATYLRVEDFKENSILRMIAERDIHLAMDIMNNFGGGKEYIPTPIQTCGKHALRKYIRGERDQCKTIRLIALELGLSIRQISRFKSHEVASEPLNGTPE